jgi:uncharacterized protein YaaQ
MQISSVAAMIKVGNRFRTRITHHASRITHHASRITQHGASLMKMVMAIINNEDSRNVIDRLARRGFAVTIVNSSGGFLRVGNTTLFCGVADEKVEEVLGVIRESCPTRIQYVTPLPPVMEPGEVNIPRPVEKHVGGATIFVYTVDHFERI